MQLREDRRGRGPKIHIVVSVIPSCLTKPSLMRALSSIDLDLQLLGKTLGRPLRILTTVFIFLPTLSLALATWRGPS